MNDYTNQFPERRTSSIEVTAIEKRLDKIEEKIDRLADSMILLARAEERLITMEADRTRMWKRLREMEVELEGFRAEVTEYKNSVSMFNRLFWIIITSAAAVAVTQAIQLI